MELLSSVVMEQLQETVRSHNFTLTLKVKDMDNLAEFWQYNVSNLRLCSSKNFKIAWFQYSKSRTDEFPEDPWSTYNHMPKVTFLHSANMDWLQNIPIPSWNLK